jgi:hypothetical protein
MGGHGGGGHGGGHGGGGHHGGRGSLLGLGGYGGVWGYTDPLLELDGLDLLDDGTDEVILPTIIPTALVRGRRFARFAGDDDSPDPDSGDDGSGGGGGYDDSGDNSDLTPASDPAQSSDMAYIGQALTAMSDAGPGEGGSDQGAGSYVSDGGGDADASYDAGDAGSYLQDAPSDGGGGSYDDGGDGGGSYDDGDSPDGGGDSGGAGASQGGGSSGGSPSGGDPSQQQPQDDKKHKYSKKQRAAWLAKKAAAAATAAGLPSTSLAQEQATYGSRALSAADLATQQSAAAAAVALGDATANMTGHKLVNGVNTAVNAPGRYAARQAARAAAAAAGTAAPATPSLASLFTAPPPAADPTQGIVAQHLAGNPTLASSAILGLRFPAATPAASPSDVTAPLYPGYSSSKPTPGLLGGSGMPAPVGMSAFPKSVPASSLGLGPTPAPSDPYSMMHHSSLGLGSPPAKTAAKPVVRSAVRAAPRPAVKAAPKKAAPRPTARIHGEGEFGDDRGTIDVGDDMGTMDDGWPLGGLDDITGNAYVRPMDMSTFSDDESCTTHLDPVERWANPLVADPREDIQYPEGYAASTAMFPGGLDPDEFSIYPCHTGDEWSYDAMAGQPAMLIAGEGDSDEDSDPWTIPSGCDESDAGYMFNPRIGGEFDSDVGHQMRLKG